MDAISQTTLSNTFSWMKMLEFSINDIPALVQIMDWRRLGDKPLSEPMMVRLPTHICVTQPQWVNNLYRSSYCIANTYLLIHSNRKQHFNHSLGMPCLMLARARYGYGVEQHQQWENMVLLGKSENKCGTGLDIMSCHPESLQWRHNGHDIVSNHQPHDCLLNR